MIWCILATTEFFTASLECKYPLYLLWLFILSSNSFLLIGSKLLIFIITFVFPSIDFLSSLTFLIALFKAFIASGVNSKVLK